MRKELKKQVASVALSMAIAGSSAAAMSTPVYAADDDINLDSIELSIDEEEAEEEQEAEETNQVEEEQKVEETNQTEEEQEVEETDQATEKEQEVEKEKETTEEVKQEEPTDNQQEKLKEEKEETKVEEEQENEEIISDELTKEEISQETATPQSHTIAVITNKVDENGDPLIGATLQIIDSNGNIVDEWISDGTEHVSLLPEGDYILHESEAPEGYIASTDQSFTIKADVKDVVADVDHDNSGDVCWHYGGVALYYIESEGEKDEVYCVNQNWEEPDGINYNGTVLNESNIRTFVPDADTSMTDSDLYNKVLDIIYHRSKAEELFPELSEVEIRFITEYALKTYTSAEVTTRQAMRDENGKIVRDESGNIVYEDIRFLRYYRYDPNSPKGYVVDPGNGDGIGKLAEHWYNQHNKTKIPEEYVALFYYLTNNEERHPEDMFLYIYSTKNPTAEGESYQNLLGVRWFDPYDEDYKPYLTVINNKDNTPDTPDKPDVPDTPTKHNVPQTGDNNILDIELALAGLGVSSLTLARMGMVRKRKSNSKN